MQATQSMKIKLQKLVFCYSVNSKHLQLEKNPIK